MQKTDEFTRACEEIVQNLLNIENLENNKIKNEIKAVCTKYSLERIPRNNEILSMVNPADFKKLQNIHHIDQLNSYFGFKCSNLIIPTSVVSLGLGCQKHKNSNFFVIALIGLTILIISSIWGHQLFGCKNEKYVTLIGSCIVSFAHIKNYFLCRNFNNNTYQSDKLSECCD